VVGLSRGMVVCQEMASCRHKPVVKLSLLNMCRLQPHTHGKHCFVVVGLEGASLIMTLPYAIYMTYWVVLFNREFSATVSHYAIKASYASLYPVSDY